MLCISGNDNCRVQYDSTWPFCMHTLQHILLESCSHILLVHCRHHRPQVTWSTQEPNTGCPHRESSPSLLDLVHAVDYVDWCTIFHTGKQLAYNAKAVHPGLGGVPPLPYPSGKTAPFLLHLHVLIHWLYHT